MRLTRPPAAEVSITDKQGEAEYLAFTDQATAKAAADALAGGASWQTVAARYARPPVPPTTEATEAVLMKSLRVRPLSCFPSMSFLL